MKYFYQILIIIFFLFLSFFSFSQTTPFEWKIIATHRSGMSDTLYLGIDTAGGYGYQKGLDIIDTNFNPPIAIGAFDSVIMQDSNFSHPAFLKKHVLSFTDSSQYAFWITDTTKWIMNSLWEWKYKFYASSDSMGYNTPDFVEGEPPHLVITWDTTDFKYYSGKYQLWNLNINFNGGYLNYWDGTGTGYVYNGINHGGGAHKFDSSYVIYESGSSDWWNGGYSCHGFEDCQIVQFEIEIILRDTTDSLYTIKPGFNESNIFINYIKIYPNPVNEILYISSPFFVYGIIEIYNMIGLLVHTEKVHQSKVQSMNLSFLPHGSYILKYTDKNTNSTLYKRFIKQ